MNPYEEIARLKKRIRELEQRIAAKDGNLRALQAEQVSARQRIETLESELKFFRNVADDAVGAVRRWRDRDNPYPDEYYNER